MPTLPLYRGRAVEDRPLVFVTKSPHRSQSPGRGGDRKFTDSGDLDRLKGVDEDATGVEVVWYIVVLGVIALLPAWIAGRKGQGFWTFYVFGLLLWIVAVPVALLVKDKRPRCPACAEVIRPEATICPHCRTPLASPTTEPTPSS